MRNDEFNTPRIDNEDQGLPRFEFGETQRNESSFYLDNDVAPSDELNDNETSNDGNTKKPQEKKKQEEQQQEQTRQQLEQNLSSSSSTSSSAASSTSAAASTGAHVATVVGSSLVAVATLSTLVGIDLFYKGRCKMQQLEVVETSLVYALTLEDLEDDSDIIIQLKNSSYEQAQPLIEGPNEGVFADLTPSTEYDLAVIDLNYDNHILYQNTVVTKGDGASAGGMIKGRCTMQQLEVVETSLVYALTLEDLEDDSDVIIQLKNSSYEQAQPLREGPNEGVFADLTPSTEYDLAVIDLNYDNHILYQNTVVTKGDGSSTADMITITFVANNGTDEYSAPIQIESKTEYTLPECPFSDPNYDMMFGGWDVGRGMMPLQPGFSWVFSTDLTLTATWVPCYHMIYHSNTIDEQEEIVIKVRQSESIYDTLEECPFGAEPGMAFKNWMVDDLEISPGGWITYESDKDIYANWESVATGEYEILFDVNGGSGTMASGWGDYGDEFELPECSFIAPEGYYFAGWEVRGDTFMPGDTFTVEGKTVVAAIWQQSQFNRCNILEVSQDTQSMTAYFDYYGQEGDLTNITICFDDGMDTIDVPFTGEIDPYTQTLEASIEDLGLDITGVEVPIYRYSLYASFAGQEVTMLYSGTVCLGAINGRYELTFPFGDEPIFYSDSQYRPVVPMRLVCYSAMPKNETYYIGYKLDPAGDEIKQFFRNSGKGFTITIDEQIEADYLSLYDVNVYRKEDGNYIPLLEETRDLMLVYEEENIIYFADTMPYFGDDLVSQSLYLANDLNSTVLITDMYLDFKLYDINDTLHDEYTYYIDESIETLMDGYLQIAYGNAAFYDTFKVDITKYAWSLDLCYSYSKNGDVSTPKSVNIFDKNQCFTIG